MGVRVHTLTHYEKNYVIPVPTFVGINSSRNLPLSGIPHDDWIQKRDRSENEPMFWTPSLEGVTAR
jgi:hypothetical protein